MLYLLLGFLAPAIAFNFVRRNESAASLDPDPPRDDVITNTPEARKPASYTASLKWDSEHNSITVSGTYPNLWATDPWWSSVLPWPSTETITYMTHKEKNPFISCGRCRIVWLDVTVRYYPDSSKNTACLEHIKSDNKRLGGHVKQVMEELEEVLNLPSLFPIVSPIVSLIPDLEPSIVPPKALKFARYDIASLTEGLLSLKSGVQPMLAPRNPQEDTETQVGILDPVVTPTISLPDITESLPGEVNPVITPRNPQEVTETQGGIVDPVVSPIISLPAITESLPGEVSPVITPIVSAVDPVLSSVGPPITPSEPLATQILDATTTPDPRFPYKPGYVYLEIPRIIASDGCGEVGTQQGSYITSIQTSEVFSAVPKNIGCYGVFLDQKLTDLVSACGVTTEQFNFADLPCPPESLRDRFQHSFIYNREFPYNPMIGGSAIESIIRNLQPAWSHCTPEYGWDPFSALTPEDSLQTPIGIFGNPDPSPAPQPSPEPPPDQPSDAEPGTRPNPPDQTPSPNPPDNSNSDPADSGNGSGQSSADPPNNDNPPQNDPPQNDPPQNNPPQNSPPQNNPPQNNPQPPNNSPDPGAGTQPDDAPDANRNSGNPNPNSDLIPPTPGSNPDLASPSPWNAFNTLGHSIAPGSSGAVVIDGSTLAPNSVMTAANGNAIAILPSGSLAIGPSVIGLPGAATPADQQPAAITSMGHTIASASNGALIVDGSTLSQGAAYTLPNGQVVSGVSDGKFLPSPPPGVTQGETFTSMGHVFKFLEGGGAEVDGWTTLSPGGWMTVSGGMIALGKNGQVAFGTLTEDASVSQTGTGTGTETSVGGGGIGSYVWQGIGGEPQTTVVTSGAAANEPSAGGATSAITGGVSNEDGSGSANGIRTGDAPVATAGADRARESSHRRLIGASAGIGILAGIIVLL